MMTTDEVGAAAEARKRFSELKGTKKQKPWKTWKKWLARQSAGSSNVDTMTLDMGGQDYGDVHDEGYLRQFEGFMEDYEAVSVALPPLSV